MNHTNIGIHFGGRLDDDDNLIFCDVTKIPSISILSVIPIFLLIQPRFNLFSNSNFWFKVNWDFGTGETVVNEVKHN